MATTEQQRPKVPSGWMYVVGLMVMFGGCGASMGITLWRASTAIESMERMVVPGEKSFDFAPGSYTLFFERRSVVDFEAIVAMSGTSLRCSIVDASQQPVALSTTSVNKTYSFGSYDGQSVFDFEIPTSGRYTVACEFDGNKGAVALGEGFSTLGLVIGILGGIVCFIMGNVILWRTRRRRRAHATG